MTATQQVYTNGRNVQSSRTMIPLKLCWAFTPWKVQGQTLGDKCVGELGGNERSDGMTYVIFSRVRKFSDVAIDGGLTYARLTRKISDRASFLRRLHAEKTILERKVISTLQLYEIVIGDLPDGVEYETNQ